MLKRFFSIKWKFLLVGITLVTFPTVILGAIIYNTYRTESVENTRRDLKLIATGWQTTTDVYYEELSRILKREEYLFEKRLFSVALDVKAMTELFDNIHGASRVSADFKPLFDRIAEITIGRSGYVAILDREGRYVLSQKQQHNGFNVIQGPFAAAFREVVEDARKLKPGEVKIVHYQWQEPGEDVSRQKVVALIYLPDHDWIVAASAYYTDFKSYELERIIQDELKERIANQKIGEHGHVWVVNSLGTYIVSKDRLRDGENMLPAQSKDGGMPMLEIIQEARVIRPGEAFIKEYNWRNLGEDRPSRMMAAIVYHPGWDWVIGASAYEEDFLQGLFAIRWQIVHICLFFIVLGSLVAYFFASLISRPVLALEKVAVRGDLNAPVEDASLASNDEIGNMAKAFADLMRHLKEKIEELERSRRELLEINEELRHTQSQLFRSEKLAAIGHLAAGVAHEINNPLGYVMSNIETLEQYVQSYESVLKEYETLQVAKDSWKNVADARQSVLAIRDKQKEARLDLFRNDLKELLPEVLDGLNRVKKIVLDLKIFARVEQEEKAETSLEDTLEKVIAIVWGEIKYKAQLIREYGNIPRIQCHPQRIGQVLMNILVNAAHAVDAGSGVIKVKTYADDQYVYVDITDNGSGIPRESLSRIFEPFFTTKAVGQGTGLGLSISYEIINKHGGDIKVSSEQGRGTTFSVVLPIT